MNHLLPFRLTWSNHKHQFQRVVPDWVYVCAVKALVNYPFLTAIARELFFLSRHRLIVVYVVQYLLLAILCVMPRDWSRVGPDVLAWDGLLVAGRFTMALTLVYKDITIPAQILMSALLIQQPRDPVASFSFFEGFFQSQQGCPYLPTIIRGKDGVRFSCFASWESWRPSFAVPPPWRSTCARTSRWYGPLRILNPCWQASAGAKKYGHALERNTKQKEQSLFQPGCQRTNVTQLFTVTGITPPFFEAPVRRLLRGACDGEVLLDSEMKIHGEPASLKHLLMTNISLHGKSFQNLSHHWVRVKIKPPGIGPQVWSSAPSTSFLPFWGAHFDPSPF